MNNPALSEIESRLSSGGIADAMVEARQLIAAGGDDPAKLTAFVDRRLAGEPLGLILGTTMFMGLPLLMMQGVLVPRLETEILCNSGVEALAASQAAQPRAIDMCCGAGNLAVGLAHSVPNAQVWAADLTGPCVETARRNVNALGLAARVTVAQGDLFEAFAGLQLEGTVDVIVCNPPYISTGRLAADRAPLLAHEPREAFDAGPYGMAIHQRVVKAAPAFLRPGGRLLFEFGVGQEAQITRLFTRSGLYGEVELVRDAAGNARVAFAQRL